MKYFKHMSNVTVGGFTFLRPIFPWCKKQWWKPINNEMITLCNNQVLWCY